MGAEVNVKEPSSHLCTNDWMGIAVCVVFCHCSHNQINFPRSLSCDLIVNGNKLNDSQKIVIGQNVGSSNHIWLLYLLKHYFKDMKLLKECEANEFTQIGIKIDSDDYTEVKKCGFRTVYKKDREDLNQTMAQNGNINIIPYEDLGVLHHNFDNSVVVGEGNIAK